MNWVTNWVMKDHRIANLDMKILEPQGSKDPARLEWHEVTKVAHYYLSVNAMTRPMQVREDEAPYGKRGQE